ncbi:MAG: hypothetical protein ABID61_06565 [Candidatus Micrarchaeota archaeon]
MDFGKCMNAALLPIVAAVILGIAGTIISNIPVVNFLMCCVGIPMMIVNVAILGWAGFNAGKAGQEIVGGVVAGGIAGAVSSMINGIINLVLSTILTVVLVGGVSAFGASVDIVGVLLNALLNGIVSIIIGFGFWVVIGLIAGAIGAFAASQMK